jgi:hypothetical protein
MFTHVAGHNAAISIESTSRAAANDNPNCLALIEVLRVQRGDERGRQQPNRYENFAWHT